MNPNGTHHALKPQPEMGPLPWQKGWLALKSIWPQMLYISVGTIAIPQCAVYFFFSHQAFRTGQNFNLNSAQSLDGFVRPLESFSTQYLCWMAVTIALAIIGYFSVVSLTFRVASGHTARLQDSMVEGFKAFFPYGLLGCVLCLVICIPIFQVFLFFPGASSIAQFIIFACSIALAAWPALLVHSPKSPGKALMGAIRMTYSKGSGISRWSAFFILLTYRMALNSLQSLTELIELQMVNLDQYLSVPRAIWFQTDPWFPFSPLYFFTQVFGWCSTSALIGIFAVFTATFVYDLQRAAIQRVSRIEILV